MMGLLGGNCRSIIEVKRSCHLPWGSANFMGKSSDGSLDRLQTKLANVRPPRFGLRVSASPRSVRNFRKRQSDTDKNLPPDDVPETKEVATQVEISSLVDSEVASRANVLQACVVTSSLIAALGVTIRQVSHIASVEGLPIFDCSAEPSFSFEMWHLEVIAGLVVLVSSCRYLLLKSWPEFAESSQAANQQVLTSLGPLDYMVVAFLPGFSEELLFRGALLPLFGFNLLSAFAVGAFFGILHLGNGRKYSFAVWATFVGFVYGCATIACSSVIVPMAAHGLNNLVGGLLWRFSSTENQSK
uniref:CAAX prenyl protease 2/Lysostaphin resistance protein A-like domain-containing protein n=1 Tax=Kalanchoe fedtschenkoi TaxID=63787 RepID=A0A7N0UVN7_KALFE